MIGEARAVSRFPDRDHFAAYNGTAPIDVSSGRRKIYRLSRRGNSRLNHAIHIAAVTQISHHHSPGRAYYERKLAEGQTPKEALRSLKRRLSDVIFARLQAEARRTAASPGKRAREGTWGTTLSPARPAHTPGIGSSAKPLPDPLQPYDRQPQPGVGRRRDPQRGKCHAPLDAKRHRSARQLLPVLRQRWRSDELICRADGPAGRLETAACLRRGHYAVAVRPVRPALACQSRAAAAVS